MSSIEKASQILNSGGLIIFPTETVYGIGCLMNQQKGIERLYKLKQRDATKPTHVLVKDLEMAKKYVDFNQTALALVKEFWPGSLTICLPATKSSTTELLGPDKTLGVRQSSNRFIRELFEKIKVPLLAPSANLQGKAAPKKYSEIDKNLSGRVDYVVPIEPDGEIPSTVVTVGDNSYNLVREGKITQALLDKVSVEV